MPAEYWISGGDVLNHYISREILKQVMKTCIAILRGINVSGRNLIKMTELKTMFEGLHFENVKTYIQSGNVAFSTKSESDENLQGEIHDAIQKTFAFDVPVMVLDEKELMRIQQHNPFLTERKEDVLKLHVTFLGEEPEKALVEKLKETGHFLPDEWIVEGKAVYLFCPTGYGNTKLNNNFFEKKLKVTATTRNWKTVHELVKMAGARL